jgi:acyl carrier protein phosphodiesterase
MNYLAHAWLSFNHPEILVGNMISDFVKGKQKFTYSPMIQKGMTLHRAIDAFTDAHEATAAAKQFFKPAVRLYAGAFVDVAYDHFLARDLQENSEEEWQQFCTHTYHVLQHHVAIVPERFAVMLPYMRSQNWLFNYRYHYGMQNSFKGLAHRAAYLNDSSEAFSVFEESYDQLQQCYNQFFPFVKTFALAQFNQLLNE